MRTARRSSRLGGGSPPGTPRDQTPPGLGIPPCEQNSWHTLVKILPCPKLRLRAVKKENIKKYWKMEKKYWKSQGLLSVRKSRNHGVAVESKRHSRLWGPNCVTFLGSTWNTGWQTGSPVGTWTTRCMRRDFVRWLRSRQRYTYLTVYVYRWVKETQRSRLIRHSQSS